MPKHNQNLLDEFEAAVRKQAVAQYSLDAAQAALETASAELAETRDLLAALGSRRRISPSRPSPTKKRRKKTRKKSTRKNAKKSTKKKRGGRSSKMDSDYATVKKTMGGGETWSPRELTEETGLTRAAVNAALARLVEAEEVEHEGYGKYHR